MYRILNKKVLNQQVKQFIVDAPAVAKKAKAGQFVVLRVTEDGERIPLTVADYDRERGTVTIIFQEVGASTIELGELEEGDCIHDFAGPLGKASEFDGMKKVYTAATEESALDALDSFAAAWDSKYPKISKSWYENWPNLSTYFKFPQELRKLIYTTNTIEGFSRVESPFCSSTFL